MATARVRQAFHYPEDDDSDSDTPEGADEEEQEKLVQSIQEENERQNEFWTKCFIVLCLAASLVFLPRLFGSPSIRVRLASTLSITSSIASAYVLWYSPHGGEPTSQVSPYGHPQETSKPSPLQRNLPYLNGALSALIALQGLVWRDHLDEGWLLNLVPGVIFVSVLAARRFLAEVDVTSLGRLKYGLKGA